MTEPAPWHPLDGVPPPQEVPFTWDAGHVAFRLISAFEVLRSMPGRVGPASCGNAWPVMLQEFEDLVDAQARAEARQDFVRNRIRYSSDQIDRADEALAWTLRYLADMPKHADAIQLWAYGKAAGRSISRMLRARAKAAAEKAAAAEVRANQQRAAQRRALAATVAAWANEQLALAETMDERRAIRQEAGVRYNGLVLTTKNLLDISVKASEISPNKVLSRPALDRYLPVALETLSRRLTAAGVPVR